MGPSPRGERPLLLIGGRAPGDRERVREFALRLSARVFAEPLSGLREDPALADILIRNERMLTRGSFDSVIRIGNVPTLRFWRDLEETQRDLRIIHYSALPFVGLSRGEVRSIGELPNCRPHPRDEAFFERDRKMAAQFARILEQEPKSELTMIRALSLQIPRASRVYVGNSLPIREWDLAATREPRGFVMEANRGANGIDGQLSTFFGWCAEGAENWCIVGDLTALYDLNAPWVVPQLRAPFKIVIINNGGGRVFDRVASLRKVAPEVPEPLDDKPHPLGFAAWSQTWGIQADRI